MYVEPPADSNPKCLQAQLKVLSAMQWHSSIDLTTPIPHNEVPVMKVILDDWTITLKILKCLRHLPHWSACLRLWVLWDLKGTVSLAHVAKYVPVSYCEWQLGLGTDEEEVHSLSAGLEKRRAGLGLPRVCVSVYDSDIDDRNVGEHVWLRSFCCGTLGPALWHC